MREKIRWKAELWIQIFFLALKPDMSSWQFHDTHNWVITLGPSLRVDSDIRIYRLHVFYLEGSFENISRVLDSSSFAYFFCLAKPKAKHQNLNKTRMDLATDSDLKE